MKIYEPNPTLLDVTLCEYQKEFQSQCSSLIIHTVCCKEFLSNWKHSSVLYQTPKNYMQYSNHKRCVTYSLLALFSQELK